MKVILFTKLLECEIAVAQSLRAQFHLDVMRSEHDAVPAGVFKVALFDLNWEDDFIKTNLHSLNVFGIAIVQLESPFRLAKAHLNGIKATVLMENIHKNIRCSIARVSIKSLSFAPAVAKSILGILKQQSSINEKQTQLLIKLSQGQSVTQISKDLGFSTDDINNELWTLCSPKSNQNQKLLP